MRGEPSLRSVAIVLCRWASSRSCTRSASSGAAAANSDQEAMARTVPGVGASRPARRRMRSRCARGRPPARADRHGAGRRSTSRAPTAPSWRARAHFSRDHLDRLLAAATGESPVALRRRLLLERAAWQLRTGAATPSEAAVAAGYGSLAAFSRAFARAYGTPPSAFDGEVAARGAERHPLPPARRAAGARRRRAATSPTGWSRTTSTACASCWRRRRRCRTRSSRASCGPGSWSCGSRARRRARR